MLPEDAVALLSKVMGEWMDLCGKGAGGRGHWQGVLFSPWNLTSSLDCSRPTNTDCTACTGCWHIRMYGPVLFGPASVAWHGLYTPHKSG